MARPISNFFRIGCQFCYGRRAGFVFTISLIFEIWILLSKSGVIHCIIGKAGLWSNLATQHGAAREDTHKC